MAVPSISTYAVLGLVSLAPMSGYDLARAAEASISHFWPISKTHIYSALGQLESLGYIEGDDVTQEGLPDKRVFTITPEGERALDEWVGSEKLPKEHTRAPFLIKMFFGHRVPRSRVLDLVRSYREEAEQERANLEEIIELLANVPDAAYPRATALFGLRIHEAIVRWADEVEAWLPAKTTRASHKDHDQKTKAIFEAARSRRRPRSRL